MGTAASAQVNTSKWTNIIGRDNREATEVSSRAVRVSQIDGSESGTVIRIEIPGFYMNEVATPRGTAHTITVPQAANTALAENPICLWL